VLSHPNSQKNGATLKSGARAMTKPRVLIADDHILISEAFRKLLEPQYDVVGTVADGRALLEQAARMQPDVIVIDIGMPVLNGLAAGQRLKRISPQAKLVYVTMNEDPEIAAEAIQNGASVYLLKSSASTELLQGIQWALKGGSYVTPRIRQALDESFIRCPERRPVPRKLTERQMEVLQLLAEGKSIKEAAALLDLKPGTVAFHKYRIMELIGAKSNAQLMLFAFKNHLVSA
jgi:DNA-binding NarL/FixJ family response regulator